MISLLAAFFVVALCLVFLKRRPKTFPPGPFSWPIVGNLVQVGSEPHKSVTTMRKTYGDIIGFDLGSKRAVFINEYGMIKEAFNNLSLCGRPVFPQFADQKTGQCRGFLYNSGKSWMEQRRFSFSYLQSGFRNGVPMESLIMREVNELIEYLKENCQKPISTSNVFNVPVINSLWSIITGERHSITDSNLLTITECVNKFAEDVKSQGIFVFFPKLTKMFPKLSGYQYIVSNIQPIMKFMQGIIDRHVETYEEGIERDLVDSYLQKIANTTDPKSSFFKKTGEENLRHSLFDIFAAGTETVSTTLRWLVFFMAYHPEIQEKMCNLISRHTQQSNQLLLKDRKMLPFVEAVIMEVLRFSCIAAIGVFHEAVEDVKFHGYLIPKGTIVVANQFAVLHDPEVWGDPENFRPERFLNEDETEIIRHPAFIPFSTGRRVCPGESLARDELFIFTVRLFQTFTVEFDLSQPTPEVKHVPGVVLTPGKHKVVFSTRF